MVQGLKTQFSDPRPKRRPFDAERSRSVFAAFHRPSKSEGDKFRYTKVRSVAVG